jgi:hypothetical protein
MAVHTKAPARPADLELMNGNAATAVAPLSGQQFLPASLHFILGPVIRFYQAQILLKDTLA